MTTIEETFTSLLVTGVAQLLDDAVTEFKWSLDGEYQPTDTGIGVMRFPVACPRALAIAPYPLSAHPTLAQSKVGVQIKSRSGGSDPFDVFLMDDQVQKALLGRFPLRLSVGSEQLRIASLVWTSGGSLGFDENDRPEWVSNFTANIHRPGTYRQ